jgi:hypothetical protein
MEKKLMTVSQDHKKICIPFYHLFFPQNLQVSISSHRFFNNKKVWPAF